MDGPHSGGCGLVLKAHRHCVSLNTRLESSDEEEEDLTVEGAGRPHGLGRNHVQRDLPRLLLYRMHRHHLVERAGLRICESGPLKVVHLSLHQWPGGLVN